jgi:hypothetical protein
MNIEKDIKWIHQEIDKIKNPLTIKKLKNLIESINYPVVNSTDNYNIDIENSLKNIKKGKIHTEDQARKIIFQKRNII